MANTDSRQRRGLESLNDRAATRRTIEAHEELELSVCDSEAFVDALLNAKPVNERIRDTMRRYRDRSGV